MASLVLSLSLSRTRRLSSPPSGEPARAVVRLVLFLLGYVVAIWYEVFGRGCTSLPVRQCFVSYLDREYPSATGSTINIMINDRDRDSRAIYSSIRRTSLLYPQLYLDVIIRVRNVDSTVLLDKRRDDEMSDRYRSISRLMD